MRKLSVLIGLFLITSYLSVSTAQNKIDHMAWDQLLLLNVSTDGEVNYKGFIRDKFLFNEYFNSLTKNHPYINTPEDEKLAYWVNLYNAIVMKMVIDNYPVTSINDIDNPWKQKQIVINDVAYSLDDIEHNILRKMNEPRIHFLLSCAAKSSPKLWNRAYTGRNIIEALQDKTVEYINDRNINLIRSENPKISKVFEWYKNDFDEGNVISFLNKYATTKIKSKTTVSYLEYDWSLNEKEYTNDVTVTK